MIAVFMFRHGANVLFEHSTSLWIILAYHFLHNHCVQDRESAFLLQRYLIVNILHHDIVLWMMTCIDSH